MELWGFSHIFRDIISTMSILTSLGILFSGPFHIKNLLCRYDPFYTGNQIVLNMFSGLPIRKNHFKCIIFYHIYFWNSGKILLWRRNLTGLSCICRLEASGTNGTLRCLTQRSKRESKYYFLFLFYLDIFERDKGQCEWASWF